MLKISIMASLLARGPFFSNSAASTGAFMPLRFWFRRSLHLCTAASPNHFKRSSFRVPLSKTVSGSHYLMPAFYNRSRRFCADRGASGEIHVIVGPMFSGKTTTLLERMKSESSNGRSIAIIKSDKDTRYELDSIVTHDGESLPCLPLADLLSFKEKLGVEAYDKLEVIGIDEAQFFEDLYDFCCKAADVDGKTVIVAGLDGDYRRRRFGSVLDIIPIADTVTKLSAHCEVCGDQASFTLRKTDETKTELIGGAEVYMPVCRRHYTNGEVVKEAAKTVLESQTKQAVSALSV